MECSWRGTNAFAVGYGASDGVVHHHSHISRKGFAFVFSACQAIAKLFGEEVLMATSQQ